MVPLNPGGRHLGRQKAPQSLPWCREGVSSSLPQGAHTAVSRETRSRWGRALGCRLQAEKLGLLSQGQWEPLRVSGRRRGGQGDVFFSSLERDSLAWEGGRGQGLTRRQDSWGLNWAGAAEGRWIQAGPGQAKLSTTAGPQPPCPHSRRQIRDGSLAMSA